MIYLLNSENINIKFSSLFAYHKKIAEVWRLKTLIYNVLFHWLKGYDSLINLSSLFLMAPL